MACVKSWMASTAGRSRDCRIGVSAGWTVREGLARTSNWLNSVSARRKGSEVACALDEATESAGSSASTKVRTCSASSVSWQIRRMRSGLLGLFLRFRSRMSCAMLVLCFSEAMPEFAMASSLETSSAGERRVRR